ncbi:universal stress protein [Psychrobacter sp. F1192]|uniref:Universal stress protein n=1 Tax=Psychrobacter coccoides TaxID=2818440 RepID=A0ABS3NPA8_9GAMM|nr:universal stress protein [Psychrobacter coccoides]MBO1531230.1 universal stress protein [Psychrobacter coccoides]
MNYKHVLLVTDLLSDADIVAQRAKRVILGFPEAKLSVLHIVEDDLVHFGRKPVTETTLTDDDPSGQWQETREKLARFIERNDLKTTHSEVTAAISNDKDIVKYCREQNVDLLIIGRHERQGIAAWLIKATADSILPNVPCDSLVVKLNEPVLE